MGPHDRLRKARIAAGYRSMAQAVRRFSWSNATYKAHELGIRNMSATVAAHYARAYRVDPAWILYGTGPGPNGAASIEVPELDQERMARALEVARRLAPLLPEPDRIETMLTAAIYALLWNADQGNPAIDDGRAVDIVAQLIQRIRAALQEP